MHPRVLRAARGAIVCGVLAASAAAQSSSASRYWELHTHNNFIAMAGTWSSQGAFTDSGVVSDVAKHETNGNIDVVWNNLSVIETFESERGTFTLSFSRHFMPIPGQGFAATTARTSGGWQFVGGTGAYEGISGGGSFEGTVDAESGELLDTYRGYIRYR
jgi:hypothetical protein